ncbi:MAG: pyridoxamine 5'-phosphate oxidase family protein [Mariprofundaceae bacterium]|nr:pyridoxamine 5'-phosphate oxidase family protein [Mariprofundaceae bacterium]
MNKAEQAISTLLATCRIGFLATQGPNGPETSMAPYALCAGDVLLHLSALAPHNRHIRAHASAGFMICTPQSAMDSPLALPRLALQGGVTSVPDAGLRTARQTYLTAIPEAEELFSFADFTLFRLRPERIRWVGGFGSARDISPDEWRRISACADD